MSTGDLSKKEERPNSKKISFSEKWKERRKEIAERRRQEEQEKKEAKEAKERKQKQRLLSPDPFTQTRGRVKSEFIQAAPKETAPTPPPKMTISHPRSNLAKKKLYAQKIKTEMQEVHDISHLTEQEIKETDIRKSALELRFKELK